MECFIFCLSLSHIHTYTHCLLPACIPSPPCVKTHNYVLRACEWERARDLTSEYEWTNGREMEVRCCGVWNQEVCFCSFPWEDLPVKMVVIKYMSCNIYLKKNKQNKTSPVSVKKHLSNCCIKINTAMQQTVTLLDRLRPATIDSSTHRIHILGFDLFLPLIQFRRYSNHSWAAWLPNKGLSSAFV